MKFCEVNEIPMVGSKHARRGEYFDLLMHFKEKNIKFAEVLDYGTRKPKAVVSALQANIRRNAECFKGIYATRREDRIFIIREKLD